MPKVSKRVDQPKPSGRRERQDRLLDQALADTFPASDPLEMLEPTANNDEDRDEGRKDANEAGTGSR